MASPPPPTPLDFALPIPRVLFESFTEYFEAQMKRLVRDIAKTLGQPDAPLLQAVLKTPGSVRPYLYDATADSEREQDMRCDYLCQAPDAVETLQMCGAPVVWCRSSPERKRCTEHLYAIAAKIPAGVPRCVRLDTSSEVSESLFVSEDGTVYDLHAEVRGSYDFVGRRLLLRGQQPAVSS